jgi:hypothetical protein
MPSWFVEYLPTRVRVAVAGEGRVAMHENRLRVA